MAEYAIMPIEDYRRACAAVRQMTGGTEDIKSGELEAQILSIETGVQLPVLVSPGAADKLLAGYQLIDGEGKVIDGAMPDNGAISKTLNLDDPSCDVPEGYTPGGSVSIDEAIPAEVNNQTDLLAQLEAALDGKAGTPEMYSVTVWAGRTSTQLKVFCPTDLGEPSFFYLSGSGPAYQKITVPKGSMIFVEKMGGHPIVQTAYRCTYVLGGLLNSTGYQVVLAQITQNGAQLTIN